jgi:hypothetical protein
VGGALVSTCLEVEETAQSAHLVWGSAAGGAVSAERGLGGGDRG